MGKDIRANIVIGAKVDKSLGEVMNKISSSLGKISDATGGITSYFQEFNRESVSAFTEFETALLEAEVAFNAVYGKTSAAKKAIRELDDEIMTWATDSKFSTSDVAQAVSEMAHAGLDANTIIGAMPEAINLAIAGNMSLAETVDYMTKIVNAAGLSIDDLSGFVDAWAFAGNRSATTIEEMGSAMRKMGASLGFFKGDVAGVVTMLGILANNGTVGAEAGTLLRSAIIRLIAPTIKATDAMATLGTTEEELNELFGDSDLMDAAAELSEIGFSAYDSQGNLKPIVQIFQELSALTSSMTDERRNKLLSSIFPTRTLQGALALLGDGTDTLSEFYKAVNESSDGYTELARSIMESGLSYTFDHFESVIDALHTRVGGELSDDVSHVTGLITGVIEKVTSLSDPTFSGLVGAVEAISVSGAAIAAFGGIAAVIGKVAALGTFGKLTLAAAGIAAVAKAIHEYNDAIYEDSFGDLDIDQTVIAQNASELGEAFDTASKQIEAYNTALNSARTEYKSASEEFGESIITKMVTGSTLSDEDQKALFSLGDQMYNAIQEGIKSNYSALEETILGAEGIDAEASDELQGMGASILYLLDLGFQDSIDDAKKLSEGLREALTSAFADGKVSPEEYANIVSYMDDYNRIMAEQAEKEQWIKEQKTLRKAQSLGLDGALEAAKVYAEGRDTRLDSLDDYWTGIEYNIEKEYQKYKGETHVVNGTKVTYDDDWYNAQKAYIEAQRTKAEQEIQASFTEGIYNAFAAAAYGSTEFGDLWKAVLGLGESYLDYGTVTYDAANAYQRANTGRKSGDLDKYIDTMMEYLGGRNTVEGAISEYDALYTQAVKEGDQISADQYAEAARRMRVFLNGYELRNIPFAGSTLGETGAVGEYTFEDVASQYDKLSEEYEESAKNFGETMQKAARGDQFALIELKNNLDPINFPGPFYSGLSEITNRYMNLLSEAEKSAARAALPEGVGDNEYIWRYAAAWNALNAETNWQSGQAASGSLPEEMNGDQAPVITVNFEGNFDSLDEALSKYDLTPITTNVGGDTTGLEEALSKYDLTPITANVGGDTTGLEKGIDAQDGRSINVNVMYHAASEGGEVIAPSYKFYAEGGYADEASIFGEAGPEWAIPQAHTERTAELLNAAREASGFTWGELMTSSGSSVKSGTLIYSPTIITKDADGVEQKLIEDKERLERWWKYRQLRESVEVYR